MFTLVDSDDDINKAKEYRFSKIKNLTDIKIP